MALVMGGCATTRRVCELFVASEYSNFRQDRQFKGDKGK